MPLDPNIAGLLQLFDSAGYPPMSAGTPESARKAIQALTVDFRDSAKLAPVASAVDAVIGEVPVRVYRPNADGPLPTIVYLHGGGWVIGNVETHDGSCRRLCHDTEAVVVSVDYRLAPEHAFPAAVDDCYAVLQFVAKDIDTYGGDASRLAIAGDSAGGNLAAVCAQQAHADGLELAAQLLVYPAVDLSGDDYPSRVDNAEGYFLTSDDMRWFAAHYLGATDAEDPAARESARDPRVSPMLADSLAGLAPAVVVTAEYDPLRDEGNRYAQALADAGVRVEHRQFAGLIHAFYGMELLSPAAAEATAWTHARVKQLLTPR